ncbi:uncharacterized protein RSE6_10786 [Rhynchosporium secalis]|uniref:Uncharacterized protein n=1 Tax=Rhynchosporium secalis TaxID=38038 RepID=A0A1E1MLC8_RHYSE|nr:uncharacterized protein RSE6_10786 [Rhynchosporium secalis]
MRLYHIGRVLRVLIVGLACGSTVRARRLIDAQQVSLTLRINETLAAWPGTHRVRAADLHTAGSTLSSIDEPGERGKIHADRNQIIEEQAAGYEYKTSMIRESKDGFNPNFLVRVLLTQPTPTARRSSDPEAPFS